MKIEININYSEATIEHTLTEWSITFKDDVTIVKILNVPQSIYKAFLKAGRKTKGCQKPLLKPELLS